MLANNYTNLLVQKTSNIKAEYSEILHQIYTYSKGRVNSDGQSLAFINRFCSIIKAARIIIGSYCYCFSYLNILNKVGWLSIYQLINVSAVKIFRNIIIKTYPKPLYNAIKFNNHCYVNKRTITKYYPRIKPLLYENKAFFLNKTSEIYNSLPINVHQMKTDKFNENYKNYAKTNFAHNRLYNQEGYYYI